MRRFVLLLIFFVVSCEILEEDLSQRDVTVIAPMDGVETSAGMIAFRWHAVDGAAGYGLRVVAPSFAHAVRLVADTLIMTDTLTAAHSYGCKLPLDAGNYEWTVTAFNGAYETTTDVLHLTVAAAEIPEEPENPDSEIPTTEFSEP